MSHKYCFAVSVTNGHLIFISILYLSLFLMSFIYLQCFLNAIVQCLSHTCGLRDYCLMKAYLQDKHSNQEPVLMNGDLPNIKSH